MPCLLLKLAHLLISISIHISITVLFLYY